MNGDKSSLISLTKAAKLVPYDGKRPHVSTLWRWCRKGVKSRCGKRIHLEHARIGGNLFTSAMSLTEFYCAVAAADLEHFQCEPIPPPKQTTSKQRQRQIERAKQTVKAVGI